MTPHRPVRSAVTFHVAVALVAGLALSLVAALPADAQVVGRVAGVHNQVDGTAPGAETLALEPGDGLVLDHVVATGPDSSTLLRLGTDRTLRFGQETRVRLDRSQIDQATGATQSALAVLVGRVELAVGSLFRGEQIVETPHATLGIKGTVLRVWVDLGFGTLVAVTEGLVEVTPKLGDGEVGETVEVAEGEYVIVRPDGTVIGPEPFDAGLSGTLAPSAGSPVFDVPGEDVFVDSPLLDPDGFGEQLPRQPGVFSQGPDGAGRR